MSGKISVEFHNQEIQYIQPNQLLIFNPYQVHVTKNTNIESTDYFTFHFDISWIDNLSKKIYFDKNIINDKEFYDKFVDIAKGIIYDNELNIQSKIEILMKNILNKYGIKKIDKKKNEDTILDKIQRYILQNIDEPITLDDISKDIGYSKEHIIRIFKKKFGLSPHAFLMNEKVNKVRNILIEDKKQNISQLAFDIGFCDQSHLNKFFKRSFGITPNFYKNNN